MAAPFAKTRELLSLCTVPGAVIPRALVDASAAEVDQATPLTRINKHNRDERIRSAIERILAVRGKPIEYRPLRESFKCSKATIARAIDADPALRARVNERQRATHAGCVPAPIQVVPGKNI